MPTSLATKVSICNFGCLSNICDHKGSIRFWIHYHHIFYDLRSAHPPCSPRRSSGTAGEALPHRDWAAGSEDQGLSERILLRSVNEGVVNGTLCFAVYLNTQIDYFNV